MKTSIVNKLFVIGNFICVPIGFPVGMVVSMFNVYKGRKQGHTITYLDGLKMLVFGIGIALEANKALWKGDITPDEWDDFVQKLSEEKVEGAF